ncbi:MAG: hypothetical protein ACK5H2_09530 [Beutenbergiaceae bacterium]
MTDTTAPAARASVSELLGLPLIHTSWRLLRTHWVALLAIASLAYVAHNLVMLAAVYIGKLGAVPGLLTFALVPMVPLAAIVAMLLILRLPHQGAGLAAVIATIGSVLVPFLVVYEGQGDLVADISDYFYAGLLEDCNGGEGYLLICDEGVTLDSDARIASPDSPIVLAVVVIAFLLRAIGARLAAREKLWAGTVAGQARTPLRLLVGYAEVVWIVLGTSVIRYAFSGLQQWWLTRRFGWALASWWEEIKVAVPSLGTLGDWLLNAAARVTDGLVTGLVTPLAWLAIGVIVYGISAADTISENEIVTAATRPARLSMLTQRIHPAVITLAWRRIADPEGRFGALLGALALIIRAGFAPVLVFCLIYTVVATATPYAVWDLAKTAGDLEYRTWLSLFGPLQAVTQIVTLCLAAPLLASWTDALLVRFGAHSQLRLPPSIDRKL